MSGAYYNEIDPYAAQWLRNLIAAGHIAPGDVDERSIVDVRPDDLRGYRQCHFFAGVGVWSYALRLAGWSDELAAWTGSCQGPVNGFWRAADWLYCRDDRWRPVEPGSFPLAHGAPARLGRLRAYGNAIVPQAAAAFIEAYLDVRGKCTPA